jgi:hypothetical protein
VSSSTMTLLTGNLKDVFGENHQARRRTAMDAIFTEDSVFTNPIASIATAMRSIASPAQSRRLTLTFDMSLLPVPRNWATAGGFDGSRGALVNRQRTPGRISSLFGTDGRGVPLFRPATAIARCDSPSGSTRSRHSSFSVRVVRTPPASPNCNAHAERFVRSIEAHSTARTNWNGDTARSLLQR